MAPNAGDRVAQRIPNLLTLFFSISLVLGFSSLATYFDWRTAPSFSIREWPDVLVLLSFHRHIVFRGLGLAGIQCFARAQPVQVEFRALLFRCGTFWFDVCDTDVVVLSRPTCSFSILYLWLGFLARDDGRLVYRPGESFN